jgi:hypothetical protein
MKIPLSKLNTVHGRNESYEQLFKFFLRHSTYHFCLTIICYLVWWPCHARIELEQKIFGTVCASTFLRTELFSEPNEKFDKTSTGLACSEPKIFSAIMSLHKWEV